jgi:hypothetical protein
MLVVLFIIYFMTNTNSSDGLFCLGVPNSALLKDISTKMSGLFNANTVSKIIRKTYRCLVVAF